MFTNFIYFIIAVLIYATYHAPEDVAFRLVEALLLLVGLMTLFTGLARRRFLHIQKEIVHASFVRLDHQFNVAVNRYSVLALLVFAIAIYGLNLPAYTIRLGLFRLVPTLQALLFLGLFMSLMAVVWHCAYPVYNALYKAGLTRRAYVISNVSFAVPVLLPWLALSGVLDVLNLLPFEALKNFLRTTAGEVTYFVTFLFAVALIGPALIQKFWQCHPMEPSWQRARIESLCRRAGLQYANILYWPIFGGRMITAGVMGLVKRFRYILVTEALLKFLSIDEIEAVIAHEIGHIKRRHLWFYLLFFVGYLLLSYATFDLIVVLIVYSRPIYEFINRTGLDQTTVTSAIFSLAIITIFFVYFRFIFGYFMRNFEREADTYVFTLFDTARPLIVSLEKIARTSGVPADKPNWHHFSIAERLDYLKRCEADRSWVTRHRRKLKRSISMYLVGILCIGALGYTLNHGEGGNRITRHLFEKIILREIQASPDNPQLYSALGDLYYSRRNFAETIDAYERSLQLHPENALVLNNLAWLYATCENVALRNPKRALNLAQRAAALKAEPHILDTLAESYYVNGDLEAAIAAETKALDMAPGNRSYYVDQLNKFLKASRRKSGV